MFILIAGLPSTSYLGSYYQLPSGEDIIPDGEMLNNMSLEELMALVHHLKNELTKSHDKAEQMMTHFSMFDNVRDIPGENSQDKELGKKLCAAGENEVKKKEIGTLQSEIDNLKAHLKHTENLNNLLKRQLELNTQSENAPSGFNPELIVKMAQEIDRLKEELESTRNKLKVEEEKKEGATALGGSGSSKQSGIPVRVDGKPPSGENFLYFKTIIST